MVLDENNRPRVLIVDDKPENLVILVDMLKGLDIELFVALSGEEALQRVEINAMDLILLDIVMPGMGGYNVCKTIKCNPKTRDIVVIFISVLFGVEDKLKGFSYGADDYISKPLIEQELVARVSLHLHKRMVYKSLKQLLRRSYHELYNPLAIINTSLEMQKIKHGNTRYMDAIAVASKTLQLVYDDLYYSLSTTKHEEEIIKIDLVKFVQERINFMISLANTKKIDIEFFGDKKSYVRMRQIDLMRVVDNTISNAIKYANMETTIIISVVDLQKSVELQCQNSGSVIKNPNKIFEDGYRENFEQIGMGIGLEIVASICRAYKIKSKVTSKNSITTFTYEIPKVFKGSQ